MTRVHRTSAIALLGAAVLSACAGVEPHHGMGPGHELVNQAVISLADFSSNDFPSLRPSLQSACGALIFPRVGTGSFLVGASHGQGILMVRDATADRWHGPVFVTLSELNFGVQVSGGAREFIVVLRTCAPLSDLRSKAASFHVGASLASQAGEHGSFRQIGEDIEVFSSMRGVDVGGALRGTVLRVNDEMAKQFYGAPMTVDEIVATDPTQDPIAVEIRRALVYAEK